MDQQEFISAERALAHLEKRVLGALLESDLTFRCMVAACVMAIARIADASDDSEGVADYLVENADLIRRGLAMEGAPQ